MLSTVSLIAVLGDPGIQPSHEWLSDVSSRIERYSPRGAEKGSGSDAGPSPNPARDDWGPVSCIGWPDDHRDSGDDGGAGRRAESTYPRPFCTFGDPAEWVSAADAANVPRESR